MTEPKHLAVLKSAVEASREGLIDTKRSLPAYKTWGSSCWWPWVIKLFRIWLFLVFGRVIKADRKCFRSKETRKTEEWVCVWKRGRWQQWGWRRTRLFFFVSGIIWLLLLMLRRGSRSGRKSGETDQWAELRTKEDSHQLCLISDVPLLNYWHSPPDRLYIMTWTRGRLGVSAVFHQSTNDILKQTKYAVGKP